jgi:hypothetical protein
VQPKIKTQPGPGAGIAVGKRIVIDKKRVTKIIAFCDHCGTVLPLWKMKCSNCHKAALTWLHVVVLAAFAILALLLLIKFL